MNRIAILLTFVLLLLASCYSSRKSSETESVKVSSSATSVSSNESASFDWSKIIENSSEYTVNFTQTIVYDIESLASDEDSIGDNTSVPLANPGKVMDKKGKPPIKSVTNSLTLTKKENNKVRENASGLKIHSADSLEVNEDSTYNHKNEDSETESNKSIAIWKLCLLTTLLLAIIIMLIKYLLNR